MPITTTNADSVRHLERFARQYRLHVHLDECGDKIIPGRRGASQLYFDGPELCLMVLDGPPANRSRWVALGGKLWLGEISPSQKTGPKVQDVKTIGIPLANAKAAIRMARVKPKRIMSEAQRMVLDSARAKSPICKAD
jgi:hypothetical protein